MTPAQWLLLAAYFGCMALLAVYGLHRLSLVCLYLRHRRRGPAPTSLPAELPTLTIQIPLYNEAYVAARAIDAACAIDYPKDRLEIQVLDDSTDETRGICRRKVAEYQTRGFHILHLRRASREGFKAGALAHGMAFARGEFVAIFDGDFVPPCDFALKLLPCFADSSVGMVQARWGHLNRSDSALTRIQSIFLDGHFLIEQAARCNSGRFFNFNGTAGIWRRRCIEEAGGWQQDTLTEDLDLSYRAQLAGWRFAFLPGVVAPAELPTGMNAFKSQQHRWAKGSIQTGRKLLPAILRSRLPLSVKTEAFFHLTSNFAYVLMLVVSLLYLPMIRLREATEWQRFLAFDLPILFFGTGSVLAFYLLSQRELRERWWETLVALPGLMAVGVGLCVNNTRAVLEALWGSRNEFVRTPKSGGEANRSLASRSDYRAKIPWLVAADSAAALYFAFVIAYALQKRIYLGLPFAFLFLSGFVVSATGSFAEALRRVTRRREWRREPAR